MQTKNSITKQLGYFNSLIRYTILHIMNKTILYILGTVLVLVGLLGFVNNPILGLFEVDLLHNIIHLATGVALLFAGYKGGSVGTLVVKTFGVIYALVAIVGLVSSDSILGLFTANFADDVLHVVFAIILIWLGFFNGKENSPMLVTSAPTGNTESNNSTPSNPQM